MDDLLPHLTPKSTQDFRKFVIALYGAGLAIAARHGVDVTDIVIVSTALGIGYVPNGKVKRG